MERLHEGVNIGFLSCRNGHQEPDEYTSEFQEQRRQRKIAELREATTFPEPEIMEVYHLYRDREYFTNNPETFEFYGKKGFMHKLADEYEHDEMRWILGDLREHKTSMILVRSDLAGDVQRKIEDFKLADGSNYTLLPMPKTLEERRALIEKLKEEIKVE